MNRNFKVVLAALILWMTPSEAPADELVGPEQIEIVSGLQVAPLAQLAPRLAIGEKAHIEKAQLAHGQLPVDLDLVRFEVFTEETEIHIQDEQGVRIERAPANVYLRGKVTGDPSSLVVLSFNEDGSVQGLASWQAPEGGERISILEGPGADGFLRGEIVDPDYFKSDVGKFRCGADELPATLPKKATLAELVGLQSNEQGQEAAPLFAVTHTARLAIETDYEFYQKFNNSTTMTNYVGSLFAYMSGIYEGQVDTNLIVTYLKIYTTSTDPWRETNSLCALNEFGKYWNINRTGVSRTIAHFLSGKSTGGGVAWLGVLCSGPFDSSVSGCINVSGTGNYGGDYGFTGDMDGNFDPGSPSVIWDIVATSHEIGHNFDSPHTHCYNNIGGSSQPIDKCFNSEPGCYSGTTSLPGPQGAGSGIIMSYCHLLTGGMSNISLNFGTGHSYGTLPGRVATRMKQHVADMAAFSPACLAHQWQLKLTKAGAGTGTVTSSPAGINCGSTCDALFANGTSVTLTASAPLGSVFAGWSGSGCSGTGTCVVNMTRARAVTATFNTVSTFNLNLTKSGAGTGTVTSSPAGINCGATCSSAFNSGTSVTLTAAAEVGSTFTGWSGSGCSGTGTCVVNMTTTRNVTATFAVSSYPLAVAKDGSGTGDVTSSPAGIDCGATCSANYSHGTSVTLTAAATIGSTFTGWSGEGCAGTGTCVVSVTQARNVTATFILDVHNLSVAKDGSGTGGVTSSPAGIDCGATCSAVYNYGTSVTLTAAAAVGSTFTGWSGEGCAGTGTCVVSMTQARNVTATFTLESYTLEIWMNGPGAGLVSSTPAGIDCSGGICSTTFNHGTSVTLTANANPGSIFLGWTGAGCTGTGACVVAMTENSLVSANFEVVCAPGCELFADGFESGDTSGWN